jgi:hypothetical protein
MFQNIENLSSSADDDGVFNKIYRQKKLDNNE